MTTKKKKYKVTLSSNGNGNGKVHIPEFILIDDEWLKKIEVWQAEFITRGSNKVKGGFQRRLDERKVAGILQSVKDKHNVPPIMVTKISGTKKYVVTDGQHRLEARRRKSFPLYAQISTGSRFQAAADFSNQAKASKVSLRHILHVDPAPFSTKIRELAKNHKADPSQVYNLIVGVSGKKAAQQRNVNNHAWKIADDILSVWAKDRRWTLLRRSGPSSYSQPGTLTMLGSLVRENPVRAKDILRTLKNMNFQKSQAFGKRYGTTSERQNDMRSYAMKFLLRRSI